MSIFKSLWTGTPKRRTDNFDASERDQADREADLGYRKLEERRVLSATFSFAADVLTLADFDSGQDLTIAQEDVSINGGTAQEAYLFDLASGTWTNNGGISAANFEIDGTQLRIATDFFDPDPLQTNPGRNANILIDGEVDAAESIELTQADVADQIDFESLTIQNINNTDESLNLNLFGDVSLSNIQQTDTIPTDGNADFDIDITTEGSIDVTGPVNNTVDGADAGITLTTTGVDSDVNISGDVTTAAGDVSLSAADEVTFQSSGTITASGEGDVSVISDSDDLDGDDSDCLLYTSPSPRDS